MAVCGGGCVGGAQEVAAVGISTDIGAAGGGGGSSPPLLTPTYEIGGFENVVRLLHGRGTGAVTLRLERGAAAAAAAAAHQQQWTVPPPSPSVAATAAVQAMRATLVGKPIPIDGGDAYTSVGRLPSPCRDPIWPLDSEPQPWKGCVWGLLILLLLVPLLLVGLLSLVPLLVFQCVGCCLASKPPPRLADGAHQVRS